MSEKVALLTAKKDLIMTAIESIQYVSGGSVMKQDLENAGISSRVAEKYLARTSNELTDPLWEQWRKVSDLIKYEVRYWQNPSEDNKKGD